MDRKQHEANLERFYHTSPRWSIFPLLYLKPLIASILRFPPSLLLCVFLPRTGRVYFNTLISKFKLTAALADELEEEEERFKLNNTYITPHLQSNLAESVETEDHQQEDADLEVGEQHPTTDDHSTNYSWPPVIRFDVPPYKNYHFSRQFRASSNPNNFLKGVKWSPDGSCLLTSADDNTLSLFTLPDYENHTDEKACSSDANEDSFPASLVMTEGEAIYDYCWYPYMSASDPVSCVFATTTRDHPIHLWDACTGQLRCTYRAYDAMDEITAAFSIGFNPTGTKIYGGYNKSIRIFDIHRPGRDFEQHSTIKGNKEGQSGIISSIAFSPSHTGMLATGSYSQTTAIHREDNMELLYVLHGQEGGVTHVQFSKDGNYLYTGGRKDPYILCWDIRKTVEVVYKLYRSSETTNQRIQFDTDHYGWHLGTGGQDGLVHIYELRTGQWVSSFQAASDTVSGFSFHPSLPMAATSSGQRRFGALDESDEDSSLSLKDDENCASVWSFSVYSPEDYAENTEQVDSDGSTDQ